MGKLLLGILLLGAGVVVGWYVWGGNQPAVQTPSESSQEHMMSSSPSGVMETGEAMMASNAGEAMEAGAVVTYTDTGFTPNPLTVKVGTTVKFVNASNNAMWVASGIYPTDELLPSFNEQANVLNGGTYEYTFEKVGTWQYQNQMKPSDVAKVVVTQ